MEEENESDAEVAHEGAENFDFDASEEEEDFEGDIERELGEGAQIHIPDTKDDDVEVNLRGRGKTTAILKRLADYPL